LASLPAPDTIRPETEVTSRPEQVLLPLPAAPATRAPRPLVPVFAPTLPEKHPSATVAVVVPALNEALNISRVVGGIVRAGFGCVVIDDGSTDATAAIAREEGAVVLRHAITLGQGAALQTGIEWALAHGADFIVTFDADGQHRVADIPVLLETLRTEDADFALGSRFLGSTVNMPQRRRLLLRAAIWYTRLATGMHVTDTHNGLRAMTRRGAMATRLRQHGMAHASEILNQIAASRLTWKEVPVTIEYSAETLRKGQKNGDFASVLVDLLMGRLAR
jgi:glycosyltransferase involved in cell wall biosynthesis